MRNARNFLLAAICTVAAPAHPSAAVTSRDSARDCYLATLSASGSSQTGLQACTVALEDATEDGMRAGVLANRAYIRLRTADYAGTVADSDLSLSLEPELAAANLNRGAGLIGLGRYQEALPSLEKAVALSRGSKLQLAYYNRAIARENLGDIRGAYFDYKMAVDLDPKFAAAAEQLARFTVTTDPSAP